MCSQENGGIKKLSSFTTPEVFALKSYRRIPGYIKLTFISAFVLGLAVHMYALANKLPNHDDIGHVFGSIYGSASGRWLLPAVLKLDGSFSAPWLIGVLSVLLLAVSSCFAVSILRIKSPLGCMLSAAILVSFPTVAATLTYMFSADAYFLSLALACFGAFITIKYRFGFLPGAIAITLSMGIYQSYFGAAVALLAVSLMLETLDGKLAIKGLLLNALKYLAALALGVIFYFAAVKLTVPAGGLSDYMGISNMGKLSIAQIPQLIFNAYYEFYGFFIKNLTGAHTGLLKYAFALCIPAALALAVYSIRKRRLSGGRIVFFTLLLLSFPMVCNVIFLMAPQGPIHMLMLYPMAYSLVVPIAFWEYSACAGGDTHKVWETGRVLCCWIIAATVALTAYSYCIYTNSAYLKMSLSYEQAYAYSNRLLGAIEGAEGYNENIPVILVGDAFGDVQFPASPELDEIMLTGVADMDEIVNGYTYGYFLRRFLGASNIVYDTKTEMAQKLSKNEVVEQMPVYPAAGSVIKLDGYIVVRLG